MKILNTAAAFLTVITITGGVYVHADEIISKEEAVSYIWEDEWNGHDDDGTVWPEASYNYHLLESWVDENYGNPDYNWSDPGQLEYSYSHWYRNLTENWTYFDDEEGGWFITDGNTGDKYHFEFTDGTWYMLNEIGEIHDTFGPHSTIDEDDSYKAEPDVPDDEDNDGKVIPENQEAAHQKASEWIENKSGDTGSEDAVPATEMSAEEQEDNTMSSTGKKALYTIAALAGAGVIAGIIYSVKKKG